MINVQYLIVRESTREEVEAGGYEFGGGSWLSEIDEA